MADNHGNTPAAWTGVGVSMVGFVVGTVGMLFNPVNMVLLWVGIILAVAGLPVFLVMARMGLHEAGTDGS